MGILIIHNIYCELFVNHYTKWGGGGGGAKNYKQNSKLKKLKFNIEMRALFKSVSEYFT